MVEIVISTKLLILISVASSTLIKFSGNVMRESRAPAQCPDTWVVFNNSCYKLITQKHRWKDAQTNCKNLGGSLVNIGSQRENKFVVGLARNYGVTVWIGLNDMIQEGQFVWADTQLEPTYTYWLVGESNQTVGNENCALMLYEQGGLWDVDPCQKKLAAVCEQNSPFKCIAPAQCPDTWVVFDNSCYKLITQKHHWYDAKAICESVGSSLVNIGSQKEDKFVVRLAYNHGVTVWIGLNDVMQEGQFVWADTKQEPTYTRWLTGEPNQTVGNENCALMLYEQGGLWNADACEKKFAAVCEKYIFVEADILTFHIPGGMVDGKRIELKGTPFADLNRFHVNLQEHPKNDSIITFHLAVRFDERVILSNAHVNGVWGPEVRSTVIPIWPSKPYVITITRNDNKYYVYVDDEYLLEYPHRSGFKTPDWLVVLNDTTVTSCNVYPSGLITF